jgi:hypothetical protein
VELEQETGMDQTGGHWTVMELGKETGWTILVAVEQTWNWNNKQEWTMQVAI